MAINISKLSKNDVCFLVESLSASCESLTGILDRMMKDGLDSIAIRGADTLRNAAEEVAKLSASARDDASKQELISITQEKLRKGRS